MPNRACKPQTVIVNFGLWWTSHVPTKYISRLEAAGSKKPQTRKSWGFLLRVPVKSGMKTLPRASRVDRRLLSKPHPNRWGFLHLGPAMMTFYLQQHEKGGRWIIDSTFPQNAYRVSDSRQAQEWLEAKKNFGFPLSTEQERLLAEHRAERAKAA